MQICGRPKSDIIRNDSMVESSLWPPIPSPIIVNNYGIICAWLGETSFLLERPVFVTCGLRISLCGTQLLLSSDYNSNYCRGYDRVRWEIESINRTGIESWELILAERESIENSSSIFNVITFIMEMEDDSRVIYPSSYTLLLFRVTPTVVSRLKITARLRGLPLGQAGYPAC